MRAEINLLSPLGWPMNRQHHADRANRKHQLCADACSGAAAAASAMCGPRLAQAAGLVEATVSVLAGMGPSAPWELTPAVRQWAVPLGTASGAHLLRAYPMPPPAPTRCTRARHLSSSRPTGLTSWRQRLVHARAPLHAAEKHSATSTQALANKVCHAQAATQLAWAGPAKVAGACQGWSEVLLLLLSTGPPGRDCFLCEVPKEDALASSARAGLDNSPR